jgi:prevent-host-death family protein
VTEAARNFADCINRVRYQQANFVLFKNGVAVARIIPADERKPKAKEELELSVGEAESRESARKKRPREQDIW